MESHAIPSRVILSERDRFRKERATFQSQKEAWEIKQHAELTEIELQHEMIAREKGWTT